MLRIRARARRVKSTYQLGATGTGNPGEIVGDAATGEIQADGSGEIQAFN